MLCAIRLFLICVQSTSSLLSSRTPCFLVTSCSKPSCRTKGTATREPSSCSPPGEAFLSVMVERQHMVQYPLSTWPKATIQQIQPNSITTPLEHNHHAEHHPTPSTHRHRPSLRPHPSPVPTSTKAVAPALANPLMTCTVMIVSYPTAMANPSCSCA